jgi:hypothetical protein
MTEDSANGKWRLVFQGKEIFSKPSVETLRSDVLNHLYYHRGQMSVSLRLLDVPVPAVIGPSADENPFMWHMEQSFASLLYPDSRESVTILSVPGAAFC